jgi:hypothetical protein
MRLIWRFHPFQLTQHILCLFIASLLEIRVSQVVQRVEVVERGRGSDRTL